jgi:hypothetical protein
MRRGQKIRLRAQRGRLGALELHAPRYSSKVSQRRRRSYLRKWRAELDDAIRGESRKKREFAKRSRGAGRDDKWKSSVMTISVGSGFGLELFLTSKQVNKRQRRGVMPPWRDSFLWSPWTLPLRFVCRRRATWDKIDCLLPRTHWSKYKRKKSHKEGTRHQRERERKQSCVLYSVRFFTSLRRRF